MGNIQIKTNQRLKNCTRNDVYIKTAEGCDLLKLAPCGVVAYVEEDSHVFMEITAEGDGGNMEWVDIQHTDFGITHNLPAEEENTFIIVSKMVAEANPNRRDLLYCARPYKTEDGLRACEALEQLNLNRTLIREIGEEYR